MQEDQIQEIALDVKKFLARESNTKAKINEIESKINKMNNSFEDIAMNHFSVNEENYALENFIRKGLENEFITKSFSSGGDECGVLITPTLSQKIISGINAKSPMRALASIETISSRALDVIIETGAFGAGWVSEARARGDTDTPRLHKKTIPVHEMFAQPKATQAIIDDSAINIENWLSERLVDSFVRLENEAFITGDGNDKPTGLLRNERIRTLEIGKKITYEMLLQFVNVLDEGYLANASFLMNRSTLASIQSLKDDTGRFIWQQSLTDPLKQSIFGIPVVVSSNMPEPGAGRTVIAMGDFKSAYKIVDRSGINLLRDPYTDKPFVRFYAVKRVGGDVVNPDSMLFAKFAA
jgi:HK97 family phage major capsid protein